MILWLWLLCSLPASARETFAISGDLGGSARFLNAPIDPDVDAFGLNAGLRAELDAGIQLRTDLRYLDGRIFSPAEDRLFDLSAAGSTPALLFLCLDVHELFYRTSTRQADNMFYVLTGLGFKGRLGVQLKGSLGFAWLSAPDPSGLGRRQAPGAYVGAELLVRYPVVDASLRAAPVVTVYDRDVWVGGLIDGDFTLKFPVGPVRLGPRIDVAWRDLGLRRDNGPLFGLRQELSAHVGFAVFWGTGHR